MDSAMESMGFSKNEIAVYKTLLKTGPSTAGPIARESGVHRSKVYDSLTRLIQRGVVSYHKVGERSRFEAQDPRMLLEILDNRREALEKEIIEMRKIKASTSQDEVKVLEGYNGVANLYKDIVRRLPEGATVQIFGARGGQDASPKTWTAFFLNLNPQRIKKKIKYQIVYGQEVKNSKVAKEHERSELTQVRYIDTKNIADVSIHGDSVAVVLWKETPKAFIITSEDVAEAFRQYFRVIWNAAER